MNNALIIHGGGLCEPSKWVLMHIAKSLQNVYDRIYIGRYSFEALLSTENWYQYGKELNELMEGRRGTFFGTCRGIDLSDNELSERAINILKAVDVSTVIVCGGDGSSRQVAEISETFKKQGINFIFPVPLTIDGINGGESIGINEAVRESVRQIENVTATAFETKDNGQFGVVIAKLQGRNRDDILANVLKYFDAHQRIADEMLSHVLLKAIPANYITSEEKLLKEVNESNLRTMILLSEGAQAANRDFSVHRLEKLIGRKVRSVRVGHQSQSNGMMDSEDKSYYRHWIEKACKLIAETPYESFSIAKNGSVIERKPIDYYAGLNPRKGQKAELSVELENLILRYMAK